MLGALPRRPIRATDRRSPDRGGLHAGIAVDALGEFDRMRNHELEASSSRKHWRPTAGEPTASPEQPHQHPVTSSKHNSNGPSNEKWCHLRGNQSAAMGTFDSDVAASGTRFRVAARLRRALIDCPPKRG